jgi:tetratricopeptide (TPR) repeat protein
VHKAIESTRNIVYNLLLILMKTIALLLSTFLFIPAFPLLSLSQSIKSIDQTVVAAASPPEVQQTARNITVRITSANNGGSGVLIARKGSTYLVLTNAHVAGRSNKFQIQTPDGQKYQAKLLDGGFNSKYDLALLQFTSKAKYTLADLSDVASPLEPGRNIYSAGFPFDAKDVRITTGKVSQLSDIPFDDGTQIGYTMNKGEKGVRQGMSGGAIIDGRGTFLGINTLSAAPILPSYTYNDGSKPLAKLTSQYRQANWGVPVYNFLINTKSEILYSYKFNGLAAGKIQHRSAPTRYIARLNNIARQQTIRIENSLGSGSGVIIAKEGSSYYVLTAKHVLKDNETGQMATGNTIITYDQDKYNSTNVTLAEGLDLAVIKFTSKSEYSIAQLGNYSTTEHQDIFVGGFPGREAINSPLWQWQFNLGIVFDPEYGKLHAQDKKTFSNGYNLIYTNISYVGMSGGPVFDTDGRVVAIHGQAETTTNQEILLGYSQGISIKTFIGIADALKVKPKLLKTINSKSSELSSDFADEIFRTSRIDSPKSEDSGERWLTYGNQLYRSEDFDGSVAAFDIAIAKGEKLTGNYGKALSLFTDVDTRSSPLPDTSRLAKLSISQAISKVPANKQVSYYYFWKLQSKILRTLEKYDESLISINKAIELEPNDVMLYNEKASILNMQKKYAAAITIYDKIIIKNKDSFTYHDRGNAKFSLGDYQGAIIDFSKAIKLNPNHVKAYNDRGNAKFLTARNQEAIIDFNEAIKLNPNYIRSYNNRGIAKSSLGNQRDAIIDFNKAIKLDEYFDKAYINRGNVKSLLGDHQGALVDLNKAITISPNYVEAYNSRGLVKFNLGDKKGAIIDFERAIKINSNYAVAFYNRGNVKSDLGDNKGAITDLSKGAELFRRQGQMGDYQKAMSIITKLKGR